MKKNGFVILLIGLLFFAGCVKETSGQKQEIPSKIFLNSVEGYLLEDFSDYGYRSLSFPVEIIDQRIKPASDYSLVVGETTYTVKRSPMNHLILEAFLPCMVSEEMIHLASLKCLSAKGAVDERTGEAVSIGFVYIQRDEEQNGTRLYELKLLNYLSLKNAKDPFVFKDGKLIRPEYIKTNEEDVYSLQRYYNARQSAAEKDVNGALTYLKERPNHDELVFTGHPNRVTSIDGSVQVEKPDVKERLFQIGAQGEITESATYTYDILDDSENNEIKVVFIRGNLDNEACRTADRYNLYIREATKCTFTETNPGVFEARIEYATTNNLQVVRNARFEALYKPGVAFMTAPSDGTTDTAIAQVLEWTAGENAVSYNLYFGTDTTALERVKSGLSETQYATSGLKNGETYYWQVESVSVEGLTNISTQSSLTTTWFDGGNGTEANPWQIATAQQLDAMRHYLGSKHVVHYRQTADIDLSAFTNWQPVGNTLYRFYGHYNGSNYRISNMTIDRASDNYLGLFGYTQNASISNLQVVDAAVLGDSQIGILTGYASYGTIKHIGVEGIVTGRAKVGGAVGYVENAVIEDSSASVTVTGSGSISDFIGGFVGLNVGDIQRCYAAGTVTGIKGVGGFCGENTLSTIEECYSTADVTATDKAAGGFAGRTNGTIINSYATGDVTGGISQTGGFIGYTNYDLNWQGKVENCYAAGAVSSVSGTIGGFLGEDADRNGTFPNNFWDMETTGQSSSVKGTGKTTEQMKDKTTFNDAAWDFQTDWNREESVNNGYPYLRENRP